MSGFDGTKNNLDKLKLYLKRMGYSEKNPCSPSIKDIDEHVVKQLNNDLFLPLINFILIDFSAEIYIEILDKLPDIKYKDDRAFIENVLNLSRELFQVPISINVDQFLSNKYLDRKLEFVASLAKTVYERSESAKKGKQKQTVFINPRTRQQLHRPDLDDFEEEQPRNITAVPLKFDVKDLYKNTNASAKEKNLQTNESFERDFARTTKNVSNGSRFLSNNFEADNDEPETLPMPKMNQIRKPVDEPISILQKPQQGTRSVPYQYEQKNIDQTSDPKYNRFRLDPNTNLIPKTKANQKVSNGDYVSRQQFNELLGLLKVVSTTVNEMSLKLGQVELNLGSQVNNLNARVLMLESTVRLLKDNL